MCRRRILCTYLDAFYLRKTRPITCRLPHALRLHSLLVKIRVSVQTTRIFMCVKKRCAFEKMNRRLFEAFSALKQPQAMLKTCLLRRNLRGIKCVYLKNAFFVTFFFTRRKRPQCDRQFRAKTLCAHTLRQVT